VLGIDGEDWRFPSDRAEVESLQFSFEVRRANGPAGLAGQQGISNLSSRLSGKPQVS